VCCLCSFPCKFCYFFHLNKKKSVGGHPSCFVKKIGFTIRKCHLKRRANKIVHGKYFVCNNEGKKSSHSTHETKKERVSTRSSCEVSILCL
jgi:hypothetical protein